MSGYLRLTDDLDNDDDASEVINRALESVGKGGVVELVPGRYELTKTIHASHPGQTLRWLGSIGNRYTVGIDEPHLINRLPGGSTDPLITNVGRDAIHDGLFLEGLPIDMDCRSGLEIQPPVIVLAKDGDKSTTAYVHRCALKRVGGHGIVASLETSVKVDVIGTYVSGEPVAASRDRKRIPTDFRDWTRGIHVGTDSYVNLCEVTGFGRGITVDGVATMVLGCRIALCRRGLDLENARTCLNQGLILDDDRISIAARNSPHCVVGAVNAYVSPNRASQHPTVRHIEVEGPPLVYDKSYFSPIQRPKPDSNQG